MVLQHHDLETILKEFGYWYLDQPPMNMMIISQMDMPYLSHKGREAVNTFVRASVFEPLGLVFLRYKAMLKSQFDPFMMVGTLSVLLFSIHTAVKMSDATPQQLVDYHIAVFLRGVMREET